MNKNKNYLANILLLVVFLLLPSLALAQTTDSEKSAEELADLEKDLKSAEKKQDVIEGSLNQVNAELSVKQRAINSAAGLVANTDETIDRKTKEIANLEKQIALHTEVLRQLVQELYYIKTTPLAEVMLNEEDFDSFVSQGDNILTTGEKVSSLLDDITEARKKIASDQEELQAAKDEQEDILRQHNLEKQDIVEDKSELAAELDEQSKVVAKINKELTELAGDLQAVTGKSYSASNIKEAVNFASNKTGVPKGFLYGMLKMETNLGKNVGGCTYAQVEDGAEKNYKKGNLSKRAWTTFQARRKTFKSITDDLDIDYRKQKVSCNPSGYAGTGGAMGVAQFMPDTWMGYRAEVARVTGHKKPSPWDLTDGVTAMALKLKRVPGVTDGKTSAMKQAACSYLGTCYAPYINGILYWAKNYKQLI
jgi:peptidoglycan hydrolase CwlO-like protein